MGNEKKEIQSEAMIDRIIHLSNAYESGSAFGRATGLTRQTISVIVNRQVTNLAYGTIASIIQGTGCSAEWLMLGRGEPFPDGDTPGDVDKAVIVSLSEVLSDMKKGVGKGKKGSRKLIKAIRDICNIYLIRNSSE